MAVHLTGKLCDMSSLVSFCDDNKIFLIEDAAQAFGSYFKNKALGSFGDFACFSFCINWYFGFSEDSPPSRN